MSWDVLLHAADEPPPPVAQMPDDWRGAPMGTLAEVRAKIDACIPGVDWSDPSWGVFGGDGFSYEFSIGSDEPCGHAMVHVRGGGPALPPLLALAGRWGWYLLDCSQGEWLHHCESAEAGWQGFQAYRDKVVAHYRGSPEADRKRGRESI